MTLKGEAKSMRHSGEARNSGVPNNRIGAAAEANPPQRSKKHLITTSEKRNKTGTVTDDGPEKILTGCENVCAQNVMRGELDGLYEGAGKLRCLKCDVNCSSETGIGLKHTVRTLSATLVGSVRNSRV